MRRSRVTGGRTRLCSRPCQLDGCDPELQEVYMDSVHSYAMDCRLRQGDGR